MKRIGILLGIFCVATSLMASSLDDAAFAIYRGEISEEVLKNNFSEIDYKAIIEKFKKMKLEKAKKDAEQQKVNALLKKRNEELNDEIKKIRDSNFKKKSEAKKTLDEVVQQILKGDYGDNPTRTQKLINEGYTKKQIQEIQQRVNKLVESEKK